jgi:hypothetical protein
MVGKPYLIALRQSCPSLSRKRNEGCCRCTAASPMVGGLWIGPS